MAFWILSFDKYPFVEHVRKLVTSVVDRSSDLSETIAMPFIVNTFLITLCFMGGALMTELLSSMEC